MAPGAHDRKPLLALVEQAQLVYLLSRYPRKQVLDDAADVAKLEAGLEGMRTHAKALSSGMRERHAAIDWDELAKKADTPELAWRKAKRFAPTVLRELMPELKDVPEAAFFVTPETPAKKTTKKTAASTAAKPRSRKAR